MLAKLVVWGEDREVAIGRLRAALARYRVAGIETNVPLLERILAQPEFECGAVDTNFIDRHLEELVPLREPASDRILCFASLEVMLGRRARAIENARASHDPASPWHAVDAWRPNHSRPDELRLASEGEEEIVQVVWLGAEHYRIIARGRAIEVTAETTSWSKRRDPDIEVHHYRVDFDENRVEVCAIRHAGTLTLFVDGEVHRISVRGLRDLATEEDSGTHFVVTPMPGRITQLFASAGDTVEKGQVLLVLEAMKMEHRIKAPIDGIVESIAVAEGDQVDEGMKLVYFATEPPAPRPNSETH